MIAQIAALALLAFAAIGCLGMLGLLGPPAKWRRWHERSTKLISEDEREAAAEYLRLRASEKENTAKGAEGWASPALIEEIRRGARWLRGAAGIVEGVQLEQGPAPEDLSGFEARALAAEHDLHVAQEKLTAAERAVLGLAADLTETTRCLEELQAATGRKHPLGSLLTNVPPGAVPERAPVHVLDPNENPHGVPGA